MGIFGGNYNSVGPGVSKSEPEKKRFFLFLDLLGRKFSKLLFLNLIYLITLLPLIFGIIFSIGIHPMLVSDGALIVENLGKYPPFVLTGDIIGFILVIISLFVTAPATCGFTYVVRNMQRQEHTWVFSDFREHFAKNFKQAFVVGIIDTIAVFALYSAYCIYAYVLPISMLENVILSIAGKYLTFIVGILYLMMHYYIYVMMVTFDLNIKNIFKNAFIFTIAKLPLNIFLTAIILATVALSIYYISVGIICALVITFSLIGFIIVFSVYPTIEKSMILPQTPVEEEFERDFED